MQSFGGSAEQRRQLAPTGLIIERDAAGTAVNGFYDRFRDRLMFPIRDTRGRVIAFGGRVLDQGEPKYLNSPETALFHKGKELYGLYESRRARQALKRLLVVEGYMDTVRLHQAGITYAVATLGTATTPDHLRRAFRLVSEIVFCFDGDRAGRAAAWRALQNVLPRGARGSRDPLPVPARGRGSRFAGRSRGRRALRGAAARCAAAVGIPGGPPEHRGRRQHADGKARFVALARPLIENIAPGVYRDLLLERIGAGDRHVRPRACSSGSASRRQARGPHSPRQRRPATRSAGTAAHRARRPRQPADAGHHACCCTSRPRPRRSMNGNARHWRAADSRGRGAARTAGGAAAQPCPAWRRRWSAGASGPNIAASASLPPASRWWPTRAPPRPGTVPGHRRLLDARVARPARGADRKGPLARTQDDAEKLELQALTSPTRVGPGGRLRRVRLTALSQLMSRPLWSLTLNFGSSRNKFRYNCQLSHERAPLHPPFVASDEDGQVCRLDQLEPPEHF